MYFDHDGSDEEIKAVYVNSGGGVTIRTNSQMVSLEPIESARLAASLKVAASDSIKSLKKEIANAASNRYPDVMDDE